MCIYLTLCIQLSCTISLFGQKNLPCYSIAKQANQSDQLHEYNQADGTWRNLGNTGTFNVESIAVDYENNTLYVIDKGTFGHINPITARFIKLKDLGYCDGAFGPVLIDDVCAITYDVDNKLIYAVHRNGLNNDVLFKINPQTNNIVSDAFIDDTGQLVDYAVFEGILLDRPNSNYITTITDIAFDSQSNLLYSMYADGAVRIITNISTENGAVESVTNIIYKEIAGIGFDDIGTLIATTLANKVLNDFTSLFTINLLESNTNFVDIISKDFDTEFKCIDCAKSAQQISNCDNEINLSNYSPQLAAFTALETINSNALIEIETEYTASNFIYLNSYFEVLPNTNFSALIKNACE